MSTTKPSMTKRRMHASDGPLFATAGFPTTDAARKLFFPGQKISLKPLNKHPEVSFTICKLSTPVTKSDVMLAKPDSGDPEQVVIKIHDPRYLDERISVKPGRRSYPWNLATEQAAAIERTKNPDLSKQELSHIIGEDLATHNLFWEEHYYRIMVEDCESELTAYQRLKDLQGSAIPRLIMAGQFLPPDDNRLPFLYDVPFDAITPAIREQVLSAIESFPSYGVLHNDITLTNIHFTPPEKSCKRYSPRLGLARIRGEGDTEEVWTDHGASDVWWARRLLEDKDFREPAYELEGQVSRFT
ncbi:hypothetical protein EV363DRAFT_1431540 [Boletus edulis]|nr:hypothetical protein EV363DRAFT_1431540 [Boletus edulis]